MGIELLAPAMFATMIVFLLIGYPVAFSLAAVGLAFSLIGIQAGAFGPQLLQALPERVLGIMSNQTLLAIPFFTFMGVVLERSGIAEEMLETMGQVFASVKGGIAYAVIFVGALLGGPAGVVAATVIAMGLISLPVMLRHGYSTRLSTGVIAASGTLAQIVPPSIVLVVMAEVLGISVGDVYAGALVPSLVLTGLYALYIFLVSLVYPDAVPAIPEAERQPRDRALLLRALKALVPAIVLLFLVIGTIFMGLATPTEAAAMGALGSLGLAAANRRLDRRVLREAMEQTTILTSFAIFILIGATIFTLVFRGLDGDLWVEHLLTGLPGGQTGFLIFVNVLIFLLSFFLDFFEIAFILLPLLGPVADKLGIDLVWFAVLIAVNMQTSFMHPPFGFALFYLRSVAPPSVRTTDIYLGAIPFIIIQLIMVGLLIAFPGLVLNFTK
ncbi:MAG: TRAP transporter large permease subunit [Rhodocyclaceae bacterium]|nr:TRAP transporter large permease subunit [Rhodocyclaceae bacterium]MCA3073372.1 TRAP transporter large permease subunit [Rhodocyclaceae bacterium]MCA3088598.1 TRAP transporter large permease subunit [Rhodocyclaceae bacterium]MCA3092618.1 TRAP transporter large permease subunit [Rhodocyclaceae bacterium]MCA3098595.1 TRAP transporter large permease subunit [Rhodocyclaceae bacterium]